MSSSLKDRAIASMIWVTIDKTGGYVLLFISNLILARLLMPEDFGCIAMLNVFLAIADILVHGGFGTALIQKKKPTHLDYTSVFYFNLFISIILYVLLFVSAPAIARFYQLPLLSKVLRIQALELIINSFTVVQLSILKKRLQFKALAIRNISSSLIGVIVCVICALFGMGVWSLVANVLISRLFGVLFLWKASDWRPTFEFSFSSVKELFGFGGFMMLSSIISSIYANLQSLLIGKFYSPSDLGYVNQAKKLESIPSGTLSSIVGQVSFPVFSQLQDETITLKNAIRKNIKSIQYINLPMMLLLVIIAKPLILLLYGERWIESIPYFQILSFSRLIAAIVPLNMSIISAKGKGKLYLVTQLIICSAAISLILVSVRHGIIALLIALAFIPYFEFLVCALVNHRLIGYGFFQQLKDILPTFGVALALAVSMYFVGSLIPWHPYLVMIIQMILYTILYLLSTKVLGFEAFNIYYSVFSNWIHQRAFKNKTKQ